MLLAELVRKFPPPFPQPPNGSVNQPNATGDKAENNENKADNKGEGAAKGDTTTIKTETNETNLNVPIIKSEPTSPLNTSEIHQSANIEIKREHTDLMKPPEKKMKLN